MAKAGFGGPKDRSHFKAPICPKCGSKLMCHEKRRIRINHMTYGENGIFWVCTKVKKLEGKEHYEPQCDYECRV